MEKEGDITYFGQTLENSTIGRIWAELKASSKYDETRRAVDAFNAENRYRKRGLAMVPTRFGISFTAKFMNQVRTVHALRVQTLFSYGNFAVSACF
jgi:xanthine dehydrogenase/oxidase